jgi:signal transduction histidine kinase/CheY-like chemotaxis protein
VSGRGNQGGEGGVGAAAGGGTSGGGSRVLSVSEEPSLAAELVRLSFASMAVGMVAAAANAAILIVVLWPQVSHDLALLWSALFLVTSGLRVVILLWYRRTVRKAALTRPQVDRAARLFILGCWAAAAVWALLSAWLFPVGSISHQAFLAFVLAGCAAGAITTLGAMKMSFVPFTSAMILPLAVRFLRTDSTMGMAMGAMAILFLFVILSSGFKSHQTMAEALLLRIRLVRSDAMMRETGRLLKVGGWELDIASRQVVWSEETFRIHELPPGDPPELDGALRFYPPETQAQLREAIARCIADKIPWDLEVPFVTAKGGFRWVRTVGRAVTIDGAAVSLQGSFQDVSEMKRAQIELTRAKDLAEGATRVKSQFLATMSHEIRTPMNGVLGISELLLGMNLDAEQRRLVEIVHASGLTLLTVINDVLDFSRIEAGRLEILPRPFILDEVIDGVVGLMQPQATRKGLDLVVRKGGVLPRRFDGDATRIRQILINLVGNAIKFTDRGGVTLSVSLEEGAAMEPMEPMVGHAGTARIRFQVTDTGPGIPAYLQSRLFQSFSQLDDSSARQHGGSGLGLAISRQLGELMGGNLSVFSELGRGATFSLEIPLIVLPEAPSSLEADDSTSQVAASAAVRPTVLVVEDNIVNQLVARRLLERLGCEVDVATDGVAALAGWRSRHYALIFMDLQMPGMDGFEVARRIREDPAGREVPIIALTANAFSEVRERCLTAGMNGHVAKPFSTEQLGDILRRHLVH